ncbi:MAG: CDP-alcohol phosphatidyltransferase family protein, partial [Candidatus Lokiarchaeota archaeon]|nr:CDP-alcohol phosphatidyltransferase family protein [Candidatus Lokiarchaeota archaeon]
MPSKFRLRYIFRPLINKLAKILGRIGLTPNYATAIMLILSFFCFIFLTVLKIEWLFGIFVFLVGIFDGVDGAIARL